MISNINSGLLKLTGVPVLLMLFIFSIEPAFAQFEKLKDGTILLEDFENDSVGWFPYEWYDRDGNKRLVNHEKKEQQTYKYKIVNNNRNNFLRYHGTRAKHMNLPLVNKEGIDIFETPILSWKTRAHILPKNANEDKSDKNDSVMSVYVVFDFGHVLFKKVPKSIRYSWSSTLPEGTKLSKLFGNQKIVVVKSGREDTGKWVTFQRNIVEDYRRLFGDDPPAKPLAILILSDGDSTGNEAKADYDDFKLKKYMN